MRFLGAVVDFVLWLVKRWLLRRDNDAPERERQEANEELRTHDEVAVNRRIARKYDGVRN